MLSALLVFWACSLLPSPVLAREKILVDIPQGTLKGLVYTTAFSKRPYFGFTGVRYAKAIDHSTRFKAPEPPEPWSGVYDATDQQSECAGYCPLRDMIVGEDDCLFLNVFTTDLSKDARRAVLVWIHGGEFYFGAPDRNFFGPDFLLEHDVVLVMMAYRLGPFGFLSTEDSAAPGNVGLKDQNAALRWIQNNIEYFGGCPGRVTIAGEGSGGTSVLYHAMSPMSAGLFAQGISDSGPSVAPRMFSRRPKEAAHQLAKALGIETTDSAKLMEELDKIPTSNITAAQLAVDETYKENLNSNWHSFLPCVEPDVGQAIFLPAEPWELIKAGKLADVPLLSGMTMNESLYLKSDLTRADYMNENFHKFIPSDLNITDPAQQKRIADSIRQFYFGGKPITKDSVMEYSDLMSDIMVGYPTQIPLTILSSIRSAPVYNYLFAFEGPTGWHKDILEDYDLKNGMGALTGDYLDYLFYVSFMRARPRPGSVQEKMTRVMTKLWTNFVITGNPTPSLDDDVTVKWESMGKENNYVIIDQDLKVGKNLFKERIDFWASIYKDILGDYGKLFQTTL